MGDIPRVTCTRPALRYMGGKWRLAPTIERYFPPIESTSSHTGGGASVLLRKRRSYAEIYNDLDGEVVGLFRVLRNPRSAAKLARAAHFTPFARDEFEATYRTSADPVEAARLLVARSFMGHGSTAVALRRRTGFRADSNRSGTTGAVDWMNLPPALMQISERLRGVVIENRPALKVMVRFDGPDTLIYADPPYLHATRSKKRVNGELEHAYKHEMEEADHRELLAWLRDCRSMVVLSGYPHPLYDDHLAGWRRINLPAMADGARARTEVLWLSPRAVDRLPDVQEPLPFGESA